MLIGIAAGHSDHEENNEFRQEEHEHCRAAADRLGAFLDEAGFDVALTPADIYELDNNDALRAKVDYFNGAGVDLAIELHLNGGGGNYSTVIAYDSNKQISARALAPGKAIAQAFQAIYPWSSIGLRGQSYFNRTLYFLEKTRMPALILEPGFLDNPAHRKVFDGKAGPLFYAAAVGGALLRLYQS